LLVLLLGEFVESGLEEPVGLACQAAYGILELSKFRLVDMVISLDDTAYL
jgi:hypothetical protein